MEKTYIQTCGEIASKNCVQCHCRHSYLGMKNAQVCVLFPKKNLYEDEQYTEKK